MATQPHPIYFNPYYNDIILRNLKVSIKLIEKDFCVNITSLENVLLYTIFWKCSKNTLMNLIGVVFIKSTTGPVLILILFSDIPRFIRRIYSLERISSYYSTKRSCNYYEKALSCMLTSYDLKLCTKMILTNSRRRSIFVSNLMLNLTELFS